MKKKIIIVALFVSAVMMGCNKSAKDNGDIVNGQQSDVSAVAYRTTVIRNNPYDSSGIRHNIILEALRNYQEMTGDTTKAGLKKILIHEFQERFGQTSNIDLDEVDAMFQRIQQIGLEKFLSGTMLNDQFKQYIIRLDNITRRIKHVDQFPSFLAEISELEQDVLKSALPESDQEIILRISSIAYHSGSFWKDVYDNNTWINPSTEPAEMRWWQWPIVTNADFIGGLVGFLLGGNRYEIENGADWMSGGAEGVLGG